MWRVPEIIWTIVYGGLYWGPSIRGSFNVGSSRICERLTSCGQVEGDRNAQYDVDELSDPS